MLKAWQRSRWMARLCALGVILAWGLVSFSPFLDVSHAQSSTPPFIQDELLIKLKPNLPPQAIQAILTRLQAKPVERLNNQGWVRIKLLNKQLVSQMGAVAKQIPDVLMVEPNYIVHADVLPNDTHFGQQWALNNPDGPDIDAPEAWGKFTSGGHPVVVAVIDSGVDYNHPDLAGRIWTNAKEIPGNRIDDDQNGYVDDVHGWDFANNDSDPMDDYNHGTHVAGTIAANYNNKIGVSGVAGPAEVRIMPLKFLNNQGYGSTSNAIKALDYAMANGAFISNNSWGGGSFSQALQDAIVRNNKAGGLFVASAGNGVINTDSAPYYPQGYNVPNIISVTSITNKDALSNFSNYGAQSVDIAAPGSSILSTIPGNNYKSFNGTSMAASHVAGALAMMWAQNYTLTNLNLKQILLDSSRKAGYLTGKVACGGALNLKNALAASGKPGSPPSLQSADSSATSAPSGGSSPSAPSGLTGHSDLKKQGRYAIRYANLSWKDNADNETGFEVWTASRPNGPFTKAKTVKPNTTSLNQQIARKPLASDVYYKVRAINASGASPYTNTIKITKF